MELVSVFLLSMYLTPRLPTACVLISVHWHMWTEEGMIVGVSESWYCEDGTGGSGVPDEFPGGDPPETSPTVPCNEPNATHLVTDLRLVIAFTSLLPFGPDASRPEGLHSGVDLFAESGTPIYSPCDGVIRDFLQDVARDSNLDSGYTGPGNFMEIEVTGGSEIPPGGVGRATVIPGTVYRAHLDHLDQNFLDRAGLAPGDYVRKGQLIGYSDNTGAISNLAPHLHLGFLTINSKGMINLDPQYLVDCGRN